MFSMVQIESIVNFHLIVHFSHETITTYNFISPSLRPFVNVCLQNSAIPVWVIVSTLLLILLLLLLFTHYSFSLEFEWQQISRTLLSILAVLNNAVVWMVSIRPPTSKSSSTFNNPLVTVPNASITICIIVTCMFHSVFNSLSRSRYLSFFSHSFSFILWSAEFERLQVSSSVQDSSQYSGWFQLRCNLYSLHLSHLFHVLQSLYQSFGECTKTTNYSWYHRHFHVPHFVF